MATPPDTAALAAFRAACTDQGLLKQVDSLQDGDVTDGIADDATLLRFLEARKMNAAAALEQFQQASKFRAEKNVLRIYDLMPVDDHEETRKMYPHWTGRRDRRGMPLMMLDVAHLNGAAVTAWRKTHEMPVHTDVTLTPTINPDMAQRASVHFDGLTRFVLPLCSALQGTQIPKSVYLIDAATVSIRQAWELRAFAQDISGILTTCYPETIDKIFLCNIPFYFAQIWSFMKKFIDPVTAAKLVLLPSKEAYSTLAEEIEHEDIPVQFGGGFKFTNGMLPDLDKGIRQGLSWRSGPVKEALPAGPIKWMENEQGERRIVATGTVADLQRADEIAVLRPASVA
ncbi:CRAL/TRIO domain-containing protein [Aspergillus ellipticus CBS 707.79]|uniref:CRAL/TRIO domain-containing protein n=1 Tax=Aspergillus ellipticus CBS 707.79 TaxID=1448320 RepID=A0A319CXM8_9EURO|nr:CRAL/TRIO domain-containing protein [Aspergillus ellipticus CBS 707.79]